MKTAYYKVMIVDRPVSLNAYNKMITRDFATGIIHGDMHSGNHKYIKSSKSISFLDFELCGLGWHVYDLAVFKWNLYFSHSPQSLEKAWNNFFNGYYSINKISTDETNSISLLVKIRHLFFIGSTFIVYPEAASYNNTSNIQKLSDMFQNYK